MKSLNIKFHGKPSSGSRANTCGQTDKTTMTDAFRGYRNTPRRCTDMRRLTTGIRSEKRVVRRLRRCGNVYLHKPRQYSTAYYTPRLCDTAYCSNATNPLQHVTILNTAGNCNTVVCIIMLYYYIMGPPSYMRFVVDRKVVMRCIPV